MLQTERDWLFHVSYALDNRARIKGKGGQLLIVYTHEELEKLAADLRKLAETDGNRLMEPRNTRRR